jgi:hypothetical protein
MGQVNEPGIVLVKYITMLMRDMGLVNCSSKHRENRKMRGEMKTAMGKNSAQELGQGPRANM